MSINNLANAPLIDTDLPTSQAYIDGVLPVSNAVPVGADVNRRYYPASTGSSIMSMDNLPTSFGVSANQKGIIAAYLTKGYDGTTTMRVAIRKPTVSLKDYRTGWDDLPALALQVSSSGANTSFRGGTTVASQRSGEYSYVFQHQDREGLFTSTRLVTVFKVTRSEYVQVAGVAGGGNVFTSFFTLLSCFGDGQFHVSDEEQPFIWNVYDSVHSGSTASVTGFRDDNSQNIGYYIAAGGGVTYNTIFGQSAAFFQQYTLPSGLYGYGPYLVHPWASGSYNPPEMWYFINEFNTTGQTTGRFKIYRSQWKKSQYVKPTGYKFGDDANYEAGSSRYPALNPLGYAFEHNVFDDAHLVGIIGPFQEAAVYNPDSGVVASAQNAANTTATKIPIGSPAANPLGFAVVRDKKRSNVLHLVISDGGTYPTDAGVLNRIWFTNSADDGATWGRVTQVSPAITPATQGTITGISQGVSRTSIPTQSGFLASESVGYADYNGSGQATGRPNVVRTHDDVLLMGNLTRFTNYSFADGSSPPPHGYPDDFGAKISMAVIDYTGRGTASADRNAVVFVQRVQGGQIAWQ